MKYLEGLLIQYWTREWHHHRLMKEPLLLSEFGDNTGGNFVRNQEPKSIWYPCKPICHSNLPHHAYRARLCWPCLPDRLTTRSLLSDTFPVIYLFSPRYAKKTICIPQSGWQGALISPEGLWKGSDSAWKEDSKGNLGDISCHVNRRSSERRLTAQLSAADPMMPGEAWAAESNKADSSCSSWTVELHWASPLNYLKQAGAPRWWHCQTANVNCVRSVKLEERSCTAAVFLGLRVRDVTGAKTLFSTAPKVITDRSLKSHFQVKTVEVELQRERGGWQFKAKEEISSFDLSGSKEKPEYENKSSPFSSDTRSAAVSAPEQNVLLFFAESLPKSKVWPSPEVVFIHNHSLRVQSHTKASTAGSSCPGCEGLFSTTWTAVRGWAVPIRIIYLHSWITWFGRPPGVGSYVQPTFSEHTTSEPFEWVTVGILSNHLTKR